jgi:hypothetical protein
MIGIYGRRAAGQGRRVWPLFSELRVPEWQELAVDWRKWRKMLKSTAIV